MNKQNLGALLHDNGLLIQLRQRMENTNVDHACITLETAINKVEPQNVAILKSYLWATLLNARLEPTEWTVRNEETHIKIYVVPDGVPMFEAMNRLRHFINDSNATYNLTMSVDVEGVAK